MLRRPAWFTTWRLVFVALAAALTAAASPIGAPADTIHVPGDYPTIQQAINAAANGDEIIVAPGTYAEAVNLRGKRITVRSSHGADVTSIDAGGDAASVVTCTSGETFNTVVRGFTITGGAGTSTSNCVSSQSHAGGGFFVRNSSLTVLECVITENLLIDDAPPNPGGGIYVQTGSLHLADSTVSVNWADRGAGVYFCGNGILTVQRTRFESNLPSGHGGGINVSGGGTVVIADCSFDNNESSHGGGIRMVMNSTGVGNIRNCDFVNNRSSHGGGVRIDAEDNSTVNVTGCSFDGGVAAFGAGANIVTVDPGATINLDGCSFTNNESGFGAGVVAYTLSGGTLNISNCSFGANVAHQCCDTGIWWSECNQDGSKNGLFWGGGMDLRVFYGGAARIVNCLFVGNDAVRAGGAHLSTCGGGTIEMINSTVVGNGPTGLHLRLGLAGSIDIANSIVRDNTGSDQIMIELQDKNVTASVTYSNVEGGFEGVGNIDADPLFVDPDNGDYRIGSGSPSIDAGDNTAVPSGIETDRNRDPRFVDDPDTADTGNGSPPVVDMGGFEFQVDDSGAADLIDFSIVTGTLLQGTLGDLRGSDNVYVHTRSGFGQTVAELHKMEMVVNAITTVDSPTSLDVAAEARIDETSGSARIGLFNWNTNRFVQVGQYAIGKTEEVRVFENIDAANYINESGEIDVSIKHLVFVPFLAFTFESFIDWLEIRVE